jgi:hypothetical protein
MLAMGDYGYLFVVVAAWLISAAVASRLGPTSYRARLIWTTLFFTGPLGVGVALIAKAIEEFREPAAHR